MPKSIKELVKKNKIKVGDTLRVNDYGTKYRIIVDKIKPDHVKSGYWRSINMSVPSTNIGLFRGMVTRINGRFV